MGMDHGDAIAVLSNWAVCFVLVGLALVARSGLGSLQAKGGTMQFVPESSLTIRHFFEIYTSAIFDLAEGIMGKKDARAFFWLIGGLFIYVLFGNLVSILPGGLPPTDNFSSNLALGLTVFVVFNVAGLARNGVHYVKHLLGPVWWLAPLMLVVEVIGLCVRPVSLSLRLMGNIYGDHTVFGIMSDLVPVVIPSIFLGLGIFVSFVQAFVFTLLTCVYVSLAVAHEEGH
jgi:F-type H+-transporting ATPase subunit a